MNEYEDIANYLLSMSSESSNPDMPQFVTVEGYRRSTENKSLKNYQIKFAKSMYNEKIVIVANISDTSKEYTIRSLQDDNNYKTRLFASVSHELRTPLNGSINFIEQAFNDPAIPSSTKENCILPALRSNRMLLCLINDFLDFSQMQANKLRLAIERKSIIDTAKRLHRIAGNPGFEERNQIKA